MCSGWLGDLHHAGILRLLAGGLAVRAALTAQTVPPPDNAAAADPTPVVVQTLPDVGAPSASPPRPVGPTAWSGTGSFDQLAWEDWRAEGVTLSWSLPLDLGGEAAVPALAGSRDDLAAWLRRLTRPWPAASNTVQVRRLAWGRAFEAAGFALTFIPPPTSEPPAGQQAAGTLPAPPLTRIECTLDRLRGRGVLLRELRLTGAGSPAGLVLEGGGRLADHPFACTARLDAPPAGSNHWRARLEMQGLELAAFPLPRDWLADVATVKLTGRLGARVRVEWAPEQPLEAVLDAALELDRVSVPDRELELEEVRFDPALRWTGDGLQPAAPAELRVGAIIAGPVRLEALRLRVLGEGSAIRLELADARFCGGRVWSEPVLWVGGGGPVTVRLRLAEIDLARVAALFPRFQGRIEGRVGGELPVVGHPDGRWEIEAGRLALEAGAPAELQYAAEGLLTANLPPGSPRFQQMRLVEKALHRLRLESLEVRINDAPRREGLLQLRLRGVSETPEAIVPVDFRLNVRGDLDEVIRLLGRRF